MAYTYITSTVHHHVFRDENGGKHSFGVEVGTWQQALDLLENPPPPVIPGLSVPSFGFEVATDKQSIDRLRDDYVHQTSKIARGVKNKNDTTAILVADKYGVKHEVPFNDYITGLDYVGDVIRSMWEQGIDI